MSGIGDGLLGPSKSFLTDLLAEDDGGGVYATGKKVRFFAVDFSDDILAFLREYDPSLDPEAALVPFDDGFPLGLAKVEGLNEQIIAWVSSQEVGRAHFYSVPDVVVPPAKKAGAKKPTNAMVAEQIEALKAHLTALSVAQPAPRTPPPHGADHARGQGALEILGASAKVPAVLLSRRRSARHFFTGKRKHGGSSSKGQVDTSLSCTSSSADGISACRDPSNWMNSSTI